MTHAARSFGVPAPSPHPGPAPLHPPLKTPRLQLSPVHTRSAMEAVYHLAMDTDICRQVELPPHLTYTDFRRRINVSGDFTVYAIATQVPNRLVGLLALWSESPFRDWPQVFYGIHPDHRRNGYMKEALSALLHHLLGGHAPVPGVCALVQAANLASVRVLQAAGMHLLAGERGRLILGISAAAHRAERPHGAAPPPCPPPASPLKPCSPPWNRS